MSQFFTLEPEVAGGLGRHTVMDRSVHPPVVTKLHYQFDGWLGDDIVESFPCILVSEKLLKALGSQLLTGIEARDVEVTMSEQFLDSSPTKVLPKFFWLGVVGTCGADDFGMGPDFRLVVSEAALRVIQSMGPKGLDVEPFAASPV